MNKDVITLISSQNDVNQSGDIEKVTEEREVFARVKSIGYSEFYQAQAAGLRPNLTFVLSDYMDYNNEQRIKYNDKLYTVIRTYKVESKNELEIVVTAEINTEGVY